MKSTKKLIILRGLPSSGKSSLIKRLKSELEVGTYTVHSTDEYFYENKNGEWTYVFRPERLREYHEANLWNCVESMLNCTSTVFVDNTNTTFAELKPYILAGIALGYEIELLEPETPWKFDASVLVEKNTHGVPLSSIQRMLARWESTESCLKKIESIKNAL